jgi:hypothetical protein
MLSSAFCERPNFSVPDHPIGCTCGIGTVEVFFWTKKLLGKVELAHPDQQRTDGLELPEFHAELEQPEEQNN